MSKILIISPHADDETLGAGGTLLKFRDMGNDLYWINVTNSEVEYGYSDEEVLQGKNEVDAVAKKYSFKEYFDFRLQPAALQRYDLNELIDMFSKVFRHVEPNIVILPYSEDAHSDHKIVFNVAMSCVKAFRYPFIKKIMCMEIISETDYAISDKGFVPNYYVNIDDYLEEKLSIMNIYVNEWGESPFPRNPDALKGLAQYRASACYCKYAEAFRIIKEIL